MQREPHFHFFGVPVHVEPFHFLVSGLLGFTFHQSLVPALIYMGIVFVGVLLHEMGHALVGRRFGLTPFVSLNGWGGLTHWLGGRLLSPGQSVLVSFAGPAVGLALGGGTMLATRGLRLDPIANAALHDWIFVNFGWALFNLVPVFPLDGGQIAKAVFEKFFGMNGARVAHGLSILVAVGVVALAAIGRQFLLLVMFGQLAWLNWQMFQIAGQWSARVKPRVVATKVEPTLSFDDELTAAFSALEAERHHEVIERATALLPRAHTAQDRYEVRHLLAWGQLLEGDANAARTTLAALPPGKLPDALLDGAIKLDLGAPLEALPLLVESLPGRPDDFVASRVSRAAVEARGVEPLLGLLGAPEADTTGARPFQIVIADLFAAGQFELSAALGKATFERFRDATDAFNLACSLVKLGRSSEALAALREAVDAGLTNPSLLDTDEDLSPLRELPDFDDVRSRARGAPGGA